jgi:hypothetical protein
MRKKILPSTSGQSITVLLFFCAGVAILILLALILKIAVIVAHSHFDGSHRFTVAVISKPMHVVSFDPKQNSISVLAFQSAPNASKEHIANVLHIPVDAYIQESISPSFGGDEEKNQVEGYLQQVLFSYPKRVTDMTIVDIFRLWMFSKGVEAQNVFDATLEKSVDQVESGAVDKTANKLFSDETLAQDNKSIQIINATGEAGIGNMFAQVLTNIGGNVVSVKTSHSNIPVSTVIYSGKLSYTVEKVEEMLQVKPKYVQKMDNFDIIISIGSDRVELLTK